MPWATLCGSLSHGHMNSERWWRGVGERAGSRVRDDGVVGALAAATRPRSAPCGGAGGVRSAPSAAPRGSRGCTRSRARRRRPGRPAGRARPPADAISQPSVSPPSTASPFRLPWQVKGSAPSAIACSRRATVGSPATPGVARADGDLRAERVEPLEHAGSASTGTNTRSGARPRRRRPRPRAPRCRSSRSRGRAARAGVGQAEPLDAPRGAGARRTGAGPCASRRRCRSRPSPRRRRRGEAEPVAERVAARERRHREAVPVDRGDPLVEPRTSAQTRRRPCRRPRATW